MTAIQRLFQYAARVIFLIIVRTHGAVGPVNGGSNSVGVGNRWVVSYCGDLRSHIESHIHYSGQSVYLTGNVVCSTVSKCVGGFLG